MNELNNITIRNSLVNELNYLFCDIDIDRELLENLYNLLRSDLYQELNFDLDCEIIINL